MMKNNEHDYLPYAGIGSRKTPDAVLSLMGQLSKVLSNRHCTLRSGGASGADQAFEQYARLKEIYLPWQGFEGKSSPYQILDEAYEIAAKYHPNWNGLSRPVQSLMARNAHQVLGPELNYPSLFLLCWTPDGADNRLPTSYKTGGTGQAIRIAIAHDIPVINLKRWRGQSESITIEDILHEIDCVCDLGLDW